MKILNKKILNKAATFLLTAVLLCWNAVQVEAYTALDGYPWYGSGIQCLLYSDSEYITSLDNTGVFEQNSMQFKISKQYSNLNILDINDTDMAFVFPYDPDVFDYIVVGTIAGGINYGDTDLDFDRITFLSTYGNTVYGYDIANLNKVPFGSDNVRGYSFYGYIPTGIYDINLYRFRFRDDDSKMSIGGDVFLSLSIVPVEKNASADDVNASILQKLIEINQNLVTSNSLQQSTIDAINQHDANEKSLFQQLIQSMCIGFSTLYEQMKKEQDDKLYGYQDTTTSEAASAFSSESDKLTVLEGELSTQSNTYVTDYASEGFDLGVLATIGSSLIFVTTWFTNFWNMGGVFTACLNFCFALSIVFFILRIKR